MSCYSYVCQCTTTISYSNGFRTHLIDFYAFLIGLAEMCDSMILSDVFKVTDEEIQRYFVNISSTATLCQFITCNLDTGVLSHLSLGLVFVNHIRMVLIFVILFSLLARTTFTLHTVEDFQLNKSSITNWMVPLAQNSL